MSVNPIIKIFTGEKHKKFPDSSKVAKQLDTFTNILDGAIENGVHTHWSRMINDDLASAKVLVTYDDTSEVDSPFAYSFNEPINLDPMTFTDEVLKRVSKDFNIGDGSHAGDVHLSVEDSSVNNPFDSSNFATQAQLAFEVTIKDKSNEKNE